MKAIPFEGFNKVNETQRPGELDLPTYTDGLSHVTCWEPTDEDIKNIIENRKIYVVGVFGLKHPAMGVTTSNPTPKLQLHRPPFTDLNLS